MQIDISSKSIRTMADRIVARFPETNKSVALETLAVAFGYRNFDTLSGILKKQPSTEAKPSAVDNLLRAEALTSPRLVLGDAPLWFEAFATTEGGESPEWVMVTLTQDLLEQLYLLRGSCIAQGLAHVTEWREPETWDDNACFGSYFKLRNWQLFVSADAFWYRATPKHGGGAIETALVYFDQLEAALAVAPENSSESFSWVGEALVNSFGNAQEFFEALLESRLEAVSAEEGDGAVQEWVGLHYKVNFDTQSLERKHEWITRYLQAHNSPLIG